ncbi:MAG: Na(+)-translocating NADH-quinone reductase subunit A [Chlamydiota bacterium]|jgi:Na+-transporting NADH:ubiquinone oxidoreductase subunit A
MTHLKIKKGLDVPIENPPKGIVRELDSPDLIGLDLSPFSRVRARLLKKEGEEVLTGEPILEDKAVHGKAFISPCSGKIREIVRGDKRVVETIIFERSEDKFFEFAKLSIDSLSKEDLVKELQSQGILNHIRSRPFERGVNIKKMPKSIFVKALESAPFVPSSEMQVKGYEKEFQAGLDALAKIADGKVHLVFHTNTDCKAFINAKNVEKHPASGPHPIANQSLHIYAIDPIVSTHETIWTLTALDVIILGARIESNKYHTNRIVSLAGPCVKSEKCGFYKTRMGISFAHLVNEELNEESERVVSGDPLTGSEIDRNGYLGFFHTAFSVFKKAQEREPFHFFRPGLKKYTASKTYLSGFFKKNKPYPFTTNQHGEHRPFVEGNIYQRYMPMRIPVMQLLKALIAEDYDTAVELGLLEVVPEDFAISAFVCPSKVEMIKIVRNALKKYSEESGL